MKRVLVADDEQSIRVLIEAALEGPDFTVLHAENGTDALRLAASAHPDIVVLDWMMPGLNGLEVLRALRRDPATRDVPVLLLSAMCQERHRQEAAAAGADAYLFKPFSPLDLIRTLNQVLLDRDLRAHDPAAACAPSIGG